MFSPPRPHKHKENASWYGNRTKLVMMKSVSSPTTIWTTLIVVLLFVILLSNEKQHGVVCTLDYNMGHFQTLINTTSGVAADVDSLDKKLNYFLYNTTAMLIYHRNTVSEKPFGPCPSVPDRTDQLVWYNLGTQSCGHHIDVTESMLDIQYSSCDGITIVMAFRTITDVPQYGVAAGGSNTLVIVKQKADNDISTANVKSVVLPSEYFTLEGINVDCESGDVYVHGSFEGSASVCHSTAMVDILCFDSKVANSTELTIHSSILANGELFLVGAYQSLDPQFPEDQYGVILHYENGKITRIGVTWDSIVSGSISQIIYKNNILIVSTLTAGNTTIYSNMPDQEEYNFLQTISGSDGRNQMIIGFNASSDTVSIEWSRSYPNVQNSYMSLHDYFNDDYILYTVSFENHTEIGDETVLSDPSAQFSTLLIRDDIHSNMRRKIVSFETGMESNAVVVRGSNKIFYLLGYNSESLVLNGKAENVEGIRFYVGGVSGIINFCDDLSDSDPSVCSGRGRCQDNACICVDPTEYSGQNCDTPVCYKEIGCGKNGTCESPNDCRCHEGFYGYQCQLSNIKLNLVANQSVIWNRHIYLGLVGEIYPPDYFGLFEFEWSFVDLKNSSNIRNYMVGAPAKNHIVLSASNAEPNQRFTIAVRATYQNIIIEDEIEIKASSPPVGGNFHVTHEGAGRAFFDKFTLTVGNWTSADRDEVMYQFGYSIGSHVTYTTPTFAATKSFDMTLPDAGEYRFFVKVKSFTEETLELEQNIGVAEVTNSEEVTNLITHGLNGLLANQTTEALVTQLTTLITWLTSEQVNSVIGVNQTINYIDSVLQFLATNGSIVPADVQVNSIGTLSELSDSLSVASQIQMANILAFALNSSDESVIYVAKAASINLANSMLVPNSTIPRKQAFESLVSVLMLKQRSYLAEEETTLFWSLFYGTMATRVRANSSELTVDFDFNFTPARKLKSSQNVVVTVDRQVLNNVVANDPSMFVQANINANPINGYDAQCNTNVASSAISVQLFSQNQAHVTHVGVIDDPLFHATITPSQSLNSSSYQYTCRFFDNAMLVWKNDSSICSTKMSNPPGSRSLASGDVTCTCYQPVSVVVSLDYVQDTTQVEGQTGSVCTNPCGCNKISDGSKRLASWKIALIILGILTAILIPLILVIVLIAVVIQYSTRKKYDISKNKKQKSSHRTQLTEMDHYDI